MARSLSSHNLLAWLMPLPYLRSMAESLFIERIGIALAAYRPNVDYFSEQLKTIQQQSYLNWVCIMTFDSPMEEVLNDPRMKVFREDARFIWSENQERLGHKKNFERAMRLALDQGVDAIGCSDQDDIWYPDKMEISVRALCEAGPLSLVHADMHLLEDGKTSEKTAWEIEQRGIQNAKPMHLLVRNIVAGCSMLLDADLVRRYPVIPEAAEYHDHWYALAAAAHGGVHAIHRPLYAYRQHKENVVGVTPFGGIFVLPPGMTAKGLVEKCKRGWGKSHTLAQAAKSAGIPLSSADHRTFLDSNDMGGRLIAAGLCEAFGDRAFARACFAKGTGKFISGAGSK